MAISRLAIIGTGLIGASVGLAAKRAGVSRVVGFDADAEALSVALERGAVDEATEELGEAVRQAELALVATPVRSVPQLVEAVLGTAPSGCTVSDVGSTKGLVCRSVSDRTRFIGGHPVCGSEAHGPRHATAELFDGSTWFLTPAAETEPARYRTLHGFVVSLGAVPVAVDPRAHDRLVALTSHLPHALANLLLNHVAESRVDGYEALDASGGSLRDMTRVAGANPRIWVDIFLENASELRRALADHRQRIEELERALDERDAGYLARWVGEASRHRRRLLERAYPDVETIHRLQIHVPDRPGVLSGITQALGAEKINIEDFEFQHLSPERGATLTLLVAGATEAARAAELLQAQGYSALVEPEFEPEGGDP